MNLTFTPANAADFEPLADLRLRAMRESLEAIGRFNPERSRERFKSSFVPEHTELIEKDGVRVGFISVSEKPDCLSLEHLYIDPKYQAKGIGSYVLKRLIASAERSGLTIRLGALRSSKSNDFYKHHGFIATREDAFDIYYERNSPHPSAKNSR